MTLRSYRNTLEYVEHAFRACWISAQDHVQGAKTLIDSGHHASALSLSVLALEELGKLFCVDGLLFARSDDHKAEAFARSLKSHAAKLAHLELYPLLLQNISSIDSRYGTDDAFMQVMVFSALDLKQRGNTVQELLDQDSFLGLDKWKQSGFYSQQYGTYFKSPRNAVDSEITDAVYHFAWRAISALSFLLNGENLTRYFEHARAARKDMTDEVYDASLVAAEQMAILFFQSDEGNIQMPPIH